MLLFMPNIEHSSLFKAAQFKILEFYSLSWKNYCKVIVEEHCVTRIVLGYFHGCRSVHIQR